MVVALSLQALAPISDPVAKPRRSSSRQGSAPKTMVLRTTW
ncbi:hypothetical protein ACWGDE_16260 [Streptomyces sp. NPDC054956]